MGALAVRGAGLGFAAGFGGVSATGGCSAAAGSLGRVRAARPAARPARPPGIRPGGRPAAASWNSRCCRSPCSRNPTIPSPDASRNAVSSRRSASIGRPLSLCLRRGQRLQHFDLRARAGRRLAVGQDDVGPAAHRGGIVGFPGGQREQRTRAVTEHTVLPGQRFEALPHLVIRFGVDHEVAGAQRGKVLHHRSHAAIGRERVVDRRRPPWDRAWRVRPPRAAWPASR